MRLVIGLFGLMLCLTSSATSASDLNQKFPYDAVVEADSVYVRSGPGDDFDPTSRLERGTTVRVIRHDPGGWYVIAPPTGSFSWIPAREVQVTGNNQGQVIEGRIAAYVGTEFGNDLKIVQRFVGHGETLQILGESMMQTQRLSLIHI